MMMTLKLLSFGRGASGVRWDLVELLEGMLARGVEHGFSLGGGGAVYDGGARHFESIIDG